ncbi:putative membrane protein [Escovopsis weberi]|uniref:Putative membrane protein n=1 Tax=Escovopsis weberi TaxID=150374 RepID=A0A0M9VVR5_ESCWE|nr:putative membrane protein [Escovopsis weberi]
MFGYSKPETCDPEDYIKPASKSVKDLEVQLILSLALGFAALIAFCTLRPRWPSLYAARKRRLDPRIGLPALTDSFFGWIPRLYRVSEEQILASAGLDAFVFLTFFKMAIRLFAIMAFFATVVLWPINFRFRHFQPMLNDTNPGGDGTDNMRHTYPRPVALPVDSIQMPVPMLALANAPRKDLSRERTWLWAYVLFTYFFVFLTIYFINHETFRIIGYRQDYLGSQCTITDRTFRLTGIPPKYRSEARVRALIEKLGIGKVSAVTMCRDWKRLDEVVARRDKILRALEATWARHLRGQRVATNNFASSPSPMNYGSLGDPHRRGGVREFEDYDEDVDGAEIGEDARLLGGGGGGGPWSETHVSDTSDRPQINLRCGFMGFRSRRVDAIDHYEEQLRIMDEIVLEARKMEYPPTDMMLVTMDSVTSCQMVTQARIDPRPGRFLTKAAPSPSDLVWRNTYESRGVRRLKSWLITIFITFLTLVWIFPTALIASWLSICTLKRFAPSFSHWLEGHSTIHSLFQNGLPTLVVSLLNVLVPYTYDWLSNRQGMISHSDVELSLVSKNFFFTFFNTFFVFAVSRTGFDFWSVLQGFLKDTSKIPAVIATDVDNLSIFYINFIMLQGIGLMPFRILEIGSVFLFPINRLLAKTPRDYAALHKPPAFQYGFYLPTALLVFNLCIIYSVLTWGFAILIFGTVYFSLGYFTFKYMVLYAMDQPQHATGRAWPLICYRIVIGLLVFEVVMVGQIALLEAFVQSVAVLPLIPFTVWYSYYYKRRFEGLMKYIALRAIAPEMGGAGFGAGEGEGERDERDVGMNVGVGVGVSDLRTAVPTSEREEEEDEASPTRFRSRMLLRRGSTLDEMKERGQTFVNPSLISP